MSRWTVAWFFGFCMMTGLSAAMTLQRKEAVAYAIQYRDAYEQWMEYAEKQAATISDKSDTIRRMNQDYTELHAAYTAAMAEIDGWKDRALIAESRPQRSEAAFLAWADAVVRCESTENPLATNGTQWGLLQIDIPSHADKILAMGYQPSDMRRIIPNLRIGYQIWERQGDSPWPYCGKKK